jgi:uncharacterized protein (DUF2235 family)
MMAGQGSGLGVYLNVERVISFLMQSYEEGDRLFLFGFSRGAYTLQIVASLLHLWGLFRTGTEHVVPYAIRFSKNIVYADNQIAQRYFSSAKLFRQTFSRCDCPVYFFGMWDSVGSVGGPLANPIGMPYISHNPSIHTGRHAVARDERRAFFGSQLWRLPVSGPQSSDIKQVWFPGVHSDIGGGYPEPESGLSKITLQWMIREARHKGLLVDSDRTATVLGMRGRDYVPPDPSAVMHDSLVSFWKLAEFFPKRYWSPELGSMWRMNSFRRRTVPPGSLIHESAYLRRGEYPNHLPPDVETLPASDFHPPLPSRPS